MEATKEGFPVSTSRLILVPALITLAVTALRVVGELEHWPSPWFSSRAGGGGAIVGISWLPFIFGPYFAKRLITAGQGPVSNGKAIGLAAVGLVVAILGAVLVGVNEARMPILVLLGFLVMLASAFIPQIGWRALGNTLVAYAFLARIPVVIIMFFAMRGNGGLGWKTHYDAVGPEFVNAPFWTKFMEEAVLPQMCLWIAQTVVIGALVGSIITAIAWHRKPAQHAAA